jgi:tRNA G46 methylase TrmB
MIEHATTDDAPLPRSKYANKLGEFPDFAFAGPATFGFRERWQEFFRRRIGPAFDGRVILEIGCYNAEFLSRIAARFPTTAFVGLDWKCKPIYDGAQRIAQRGLNNIALLRARGQDISRVFAQSEVEEIWVFHPEPGGDDANPKFGLIAEPFLIDAHWVLRDRSSILAFKTDHPECFQRIVRRSENPRPTEPHSRIGDSFNVACSSSNYWHDPDALAHTSARLFSGEVTAYESRFIKRWLPIHYLELLKK